MPNGSIPILNHQSLSLPTRCSSPEDLLIVNLGPDSRLAQYMDWKPPNRISAGIHTALLRRLGSIADRPGAESFWFNAAVP